MTYSEPFLDSRPPLPTPRKWRRYRTYTLQRYGDDFGRPNVYCSLVIHPEGNRLSVTRFAVDLGVIPSDRFDSASLEPASAAAHLRWMRATVASDPAFKLERYVSAVPSSPAPVVPRRTPTPKAPTLTSPDPSPDAPGRSLHSCRQCYFEAPPAAVGQGTSAHQLLRTHSLEEHDLHIPARCSTRCRYAAPIPTQLLRTNSRA